MRYSFSVAFILLHALTLIAARLPQYPIIGAYPNAQTDGGYRNAFGDGKNIGDPGFIMTGPACAARHSSSTTYMQKIVRLQPTVCIQAPTNPYVYSGAPTGTLC